MMITLKECQGMIALKNLEVFEISAKHVWAAQGGLKDSKDFKLVKLNFEKLAIIIWLSNSRSFGYIATRQRLYMKMKGLLLPKWGQSRSNLGDWGYLYSSTSHSIQTPFLQFVWSCRFLSLCSSRLHVPLFLTSSLRCLHLVDLEGQHLILPQPLASSNLIHPHRRRSNPRPHEPTSLPPRPSPPQPIQFQFLRKPLHLPLRIIFGLHTGKHAHTLQHAPHHLRDLRRVHRLRWRQLL